MTWPALCDPIPGIAPDAFYAATDQIRNFCNWHVAPVVEETAVYDGTWSVLLMLRSLRVVGVTEVIVDGTAVTDFTWSHAGYLWRQAGWGYGLRSVSVTFTHGYDTCPNELLSLVQTIAQSNLAGTPSSVQVGNVRVQYSSQTSSGSMMSPFAPTLDRYRVPSGGQ